MSSGTALLLPNLVTFGKQEGFTEKVLDYSFERSRFVRQRVFGPKDIADDVRILNEELDLAAKVHQHDRVLVTIKAINSFRRVVFVEKPAEDWLGRFEIVFRTFLLQCLILQYSSGIAKEESVVAAQLGDALKCVKHCLSHRVEVFVAGVGDAE